MNTENFGSSERLVTAAYVRQGAQGRRGHELLLRALLEQVTGPAGGGPAAPEIPVGVSPARCPARCGHGAAALSYPAVVGLLLLSRVKQPLTL